MGTTEPKELRFEDIEKLSEKELLTDRVLQRDIHFTVVESVSSDDKKRAIQGFKDDKKAVPEGLANRQVIPYRGNDIFRIKDTQHVYFFDDGWPGEQHPNYLKPEDIIDSGWWSGTLDYSETSKKHALETLIAINAQVEISPFGLDEKGQLDLTTHKPTIVPIKDMKTLEAALYLKNDTAKNALDHINRPFNKPLYRADIESGQVERYNSVKEVWEPSKDLNNIYEHGKEDRRFHRKDSKRLV